MEQQNRTSLSQLKASKNYLHNTVEDIKIRVPKGYKAEIKAYAEQRGQSLNDFVCEIICKKCGLKYDSKRK